MSTSSIRFDAAYSTPELKAAAEQLERWLERRPTVQYFTFDQLYADLCHAVDTDALNRVLLRLVAAGQLNVTYRVKLDEGEYSEDDFESPADIPAFVFDSAFEPFEVDERDKVPSYAPASK